jgi:hypothetical protein
MSGATRKPQVKYAGLLARSIGKRGAKVIRDMERLAKSFRGTPVLSPLPWALNKKEAR